MSIILLRFFVTTLVTCLSLSKSKVLSCLTYMLTAMEARLHTATCEHKRYKRFILTQCKASSSSWAAGDYKHVCFAIIWFVLTWWQNRQAYKPQQPMLQLQPLLQLFFHYWLLKRLTVYSYLVDFPVFIFLYSFLDQTTILYFLITSNNQPFPTNIHT